MDFLASDIILTILKGYHFTVMFRVTISDYHYTILSEKGVISLFYIGIQVQIPFAFNSFQKLIDHFLSCS